MPELPEVETVCNALRPSLINKRIKNVTVRNPKLRHRVESTDFDFILNKEITSFKRRAKYIIASFSDTDHILVHLGMTGKHRVCSPAIDYKKHEHIIFHLEDGLDWRYEDVRRFGFIIPFKGKLADCEMLTKLGPEPLTDKFDATYLYNSIKEKNKAIKTLIMDNPIVVGVGNIYASESLFIAGISPEKAGKKLTKRQCEKLVDAIKEILQKAIDAGGTTIVDFETPNGNEGYFFRELKVYGKENENCSVCNTVIKKIKQTGRSTFFCPKCQK